MMKLGEFMNLEGVLKLSEIIKLEDEIKAASDAYYNTDNPIMCDDDFDMLVDNLRELDPENKLLREPDWGNEAKEHNGKKLLPHKVVIKGISRKIKDFSEALVEVEGKSVEAKLDGIAGFCYYEGGKLISVLTRNNGSEGIDIKGNINISRLQNLIKGDGVVQVEVVMKIEDWKKNYNPAVNPSPRNLIAGICSKLRVEDWEREIATPVILDILEGEVNWEGLE